MDRDWLDDIRDKMEDFEESAPEGLWRGIESSLDVPRTRRTVILPWVLRTAAVAAALAAVVLAGTQLARNGQKSTIDPNNPNQLTEVGSDAGSTQENQDSPKTIPSSSVNHGILAPSDASADSRLVAQAQDIPAAVPSQDLRGQAATSPEEEAAVLQDDVLPAEDAAVSADNNDRKAVAEAGLLDEGDPLEGYSGSHDGEDWSDYLSASMDESGNGGGRLQLKLSLGGGTASSETSSTFDTRQFYHGAPSSAKVPEFSGSSRTMFAAQAPSVTNTTVHKRPVRAEVLVHIPVFWRFGVETGLAYSVLRSSFDTTSGTTRTEESQTLRYLGLPLNLTADVFRNRWMTAYLSGGAIAAKCISADVRTTTVNVLSGDNLTDPEKTGLTVEPWLFSLNATAGFQFNVTPAIGLYAAPGVSYHFDDKSGLQTFYKEHPLDFVLSFGLRFNFK